MRAINLAICIAATATALLASMAWRMPVLAEDHTKEKRVTEAATGTPAPTSEAALLLTLVHAALAESAWNATDRAAQWHLLKRKADRTGKPLDATIRSYVSAFKVGLSDRSRWKLQLTEACDEPEGWQEGVEGPWSTYVKRCGRLFEDARAFLDGTLVDPCARASHWGSRTIRRDAERAARAVKAGRWLPAKCSGRTANAYFVEVRR